MNEIRLHIPTVSTQRLRLDPISLEHSKGMFDLWSDACVCRYSGTVTDYDRNVIEMPAASRAESDRVIDFWLKAAIDGWGFRWAVLLAGAEDAFAGIVGFNSLLDCSEIAYHLMPRYWGKGIMTEACKAAIAWQRGNGASEIDALIAPENAPSIALAHRLGMEPADQLSDGSRRYRVSLRCATGSDR